MNMGPKEIVAAAKAIQGECHKYLQNIENRQSAAETLVDDLIDDAIMNIVFEVDMERKLKGLREHEGGGEEEEGASAFQFNDSPGVDIFGHTINEKFLDCNCPCCSRAIAAAKFAPHLAKCMGMGRNSSRIARSRIANNANKDTSGPSVSVSDDEDDQDWSMLAEKKGKKKKEKIVTKKSAKPKPKGAGSSEGSYANISYESMSERDRRALLSQICGVMSEISKKVCTKSTRCPLHTDEQKRSLRDMFLSETVEPFFIENLQIDVDTCEDDDDMVKDGLIRSWEAENSNTSSPADSASTSSSSSKKRDKNTLSKKKEQ